MKQVLVTGGAGFIGSNLCQALLNRGYYVYCLDNLSNGRKENIEEFLNNENFKFIYGDILNYETCLDVTKNIDCVFHEAALGSVPRSLKYPLDYNANNISGMLNMLEASRINGVKKFVFASSSSVYGNDKSFLKTEENVGNVLSFYALNKKVDEEYARLYYELFNFKTIGLRYFNVFGPKQKYDYKYSAVIPKFILNMINGENSEIFGDGEQSRDFTYVDNIVEANIKAMNCENTEAYGKAFNVGCNTSISVNRLYNILATKLNTKITPIYKEKRQGDILNSRADYSFATKVLGYKPIVSFEQGIAKTVDWYKKELDNHEEKEKC